MLFVDFLEKVLTGYVAKEGGGGGGAEGVRGNLYFPLKNSGSAEFV